MFVALCWTVVWLFYAVVGVTSAATRAAAFEGSAKAGYMVGSLLPVIIAWIVVWKLYAFFGALGELKDNPTNEAVEKALRKQASFWLWLGGLCSLFALAFAALGVLAVLTRGLR